MNANVLIRAARIDEAQQIKDLHDRAIQKLCREEYTPEEIQGWVNRAKLEKYQQRLTQHRCFVAERDKNLIGQVRWNPETKELCSIFVEPEYARQGIASLLMKKVYEDMRSYKVEESWLDASLNAVPFYLDEGWQFIEVRTHGFLECVRMVKRLITED
jgi:GNAT superfamily N-acetyltransferase